MSMNWQLFVALKAVKSRLPFGEALRRLKRRKVGYRPHPSNIGSTVEDLARLYALLHARGGRMSGTVLEIGTGWFPISGILARLAGAERVILTDITPHMDALTFATAREIVTERLDQLAPLFGFDAAAARAILAEAHTPEALGLDYHAPFRLDALPERSLDVVISRACLEHIPVPDLRGLMAGLFGKLRDDGVMIHATDNSDHLPDLERAEARLDRAPDAGGGEPAAPPAIRRAVSRGGLQGRGRGSVHSRTHPPAGRRLGSGAALRLDDAG